MTIVELSNLDTFIRDSLYEVRRGIANSRNATQANPMTGVMVDLPEKIDFEVMVATNYQSLNRITSTNENQSGFDAQGSREISNTLDYTIDFQSNLEAQNSNENALRQTNEQSTDTNTVTDNSSDKDILSSVSSVSENKGGGGGSSDSVTKIQTETQSGRINESSSGGSSGNETSAEKTQEEKSEQEKSVGKKENTSGSYQGERHLEANDRASVTFDEDEGSWGQQGGISTPKLPGAPCSC